MVLNTKMLTINTLFVFAVSSVIVSACQTKQITILSDFSNEEDINFFKTTLPWIADNVGQVLNIRYHFKDSDGEKECILEQMKGNTYLQVSYLSKTAQGIPTKDAVGNCKINNRKLQQCFKRKVTGFTKKTNREFSKVKSETTPVIILPRNKEICGHNPEIMLKNICMLFGRKQPFGCLRPKEFPREDIPGTEASEVTPQSETSTDPNKNPNSLPAESTPNGGINNEVTTTEATITETATATDTTTDTPSVETTPTTTTESP